METGVQRKTSQRDAIVAAFEATERPLSPQEVLEAAQSDVPKLGIATVYRNLKRLVDDDWLVPVELPGEQTRYERAGKHHHHHFHCQHCDRVFEVEGCVETIRQLTPAGFVLESHDLLLMGQCADCAGKAAGRKPNGR